MKYVMPTRFQVVQILMRLTTMKMRQKTMDHVSCRSMDVLTLQHAIMTEVLTMMTILVNLRVVQVV